MTTPSETDIKLNPFFPPDDEFVKFMTTPTDKSEVASLQIMTAEEAHLISVSYKIGDRSKYHTCDTIRALGWALEQLTDLLAQVELSSHNLEMARSEIEARRSLLDELIKERDSLTSQVERSGERCEKLSTDKRRLADENAELKALLIKRREQIDKANADGAVMRGELEKLANGEADQDTTAFHVHKLLISTSCGADLLARVKELEGEIQSLKVKVALGDNAFKEQIAQSHQRDIALNAAREALEKLRLSAGLILFERARGDHALSQIQAVSEQKEIRGTIGEMCG